MLSKFKFTISKQRTLTNSLCLSLADVFAGEAFSEGVKDIDADDFARNLAHKLAAAGVGCIAASAKNQSCDAGAIGAAVGEMVGDYLVEQGNESNLSAADKRDILNRHDPNSIKKQLDVLVKQQGFSPSQAYAKLQLGNRTYFNKSWDANTIVNTTDFARNETIKKGVIGRRYTTYYRGEAITISVQSNGKVSTAYGSKRYQLSDFGY